MENTIRAAVLDLAWAPVVEKGKGDRRGEWSVRSGMTDEGWTDQASLRDQSRDRLRERNVPLSKGAIRGGCRIRISLHLESEQSSRHHDNLLTNHHFSPIGHSLLVPLCVQYTKYTTGITCTATTDVT